MIPIQKPFDILKQKLMGCLLEREANWIIVDVVDSPTVPAKHLNCTCFEFLFMQGSGISAEFSMFFLEDEM